MRSNFGRFTLRNKYDTRWINTLYGLHCLFRFEAFFPRLPEGDQKELGER
jgi:hypothetical protein